MPSPTKMTQGPSSSRPNPYTPSKPWYQHINLDLILHILSRSIFHPAIVYIFYLCLAAVHRHRQPLATYTLYWATGLLFISLLKLLNRRLTYGTSRSLKWDEEVVVITGGASGLGRVMAEMYALRGVSVCVLDVKVPDAEANEMMDGGNGSLNWYVCDVGDAKAVDDVMKKIREEVGVPTILVNNAAAPIEGASAFGSDGLDIAKVQRGNGVNMLSHFYTLSPFLAGISTSPPTQGFTIVTVSSILAHLAPANLASYAASKAAISSLHHTLTHELRHNNKSSLDSRVKTILVEVGHMDTSLFRGVRLPWYAQFLGPVLEVKDVAKAIVGMIDSGEAGVLRMPAYARLLVPWYGGLPGALQMLIRWIGGIDQAVEVSGEKED